MSPGICLGMEPDIKYGDEGQETWIEIEPPTEKKLGKMKRAIKRKFYIFEGQSFTSSDDEVVVVAREVIDELVKRLERINKWNIEITPSSLMITDRNNEEIFNLLPEV